ncbi:flavodoxin family protein [Candidatus Bipolaricaulota bacterium]|nr:flavodoxin family protein [Candidatus Bipolaricaulota bacterium]
MNIGIVVYSQTGHTLEVCEKLAERLIGEGHSVALEQVTVVGGRTPKTKDFELETKPTVEGYDAIVFASYVEAFSLCAVLSRYLKAIGSIQGKHVACLVTQQFPYSWMGGSRAIKQMKKACQSKGATVRATGIVNWAKSRREATMAEAINRLGKAF